MSDPQNHADSPSSHGLHYLAGSDHGEVDLLPQDMLDSGNAKATVVFGREASIITAKRDIGYHSKPHAHAAEQFNYMLSGRAWVFIDTAGYLIGPGDILRIPAGAVHWAWVLDDAPVSVIEVHVPPLTAQYASGRIPLGLTDEELAEVKHVTNEWVADVDWQAIERRVVGRSYGDRTVA